MHVHGHMLQCINADTHNTDTRKHIYSSSHCRVFRHTDTIRRDIGDTDRDIGETETDRDIGETERYIGETERDIGETDTDREKTET